ncbi:DNA translocase FtsK 4TM domain-containing protein [Candidatus Uhrbacteria bacterium]|nr:DNA translocase FtsK 4TM domain-containing protein [Candidatus Uhrbacteria bacterium]
MARRALPRKERNGRTRERHVERPVMSPETRRGVAIVALFAIGTVGALAFAGIAGRAGTAIADAFRALFGLGAFLVPVVALIIAAMLLREASAGFTGANIFGIALLAASITGLLHLRLGPDAPIALPTIADGGGYLGLVLAVPMVALFGPIASAVLLACGVIIGIFLGFHLSFDHLRRGVRAIIAWIRSIRLAILTARYRGRHEETVEPTFQQRALDATEEPDTENPASDVAVDAHASRLTPHASDHDAIIREARKPRRRRPRVELPLDLLSNEVGKPTSGDIRVAQEIIRATLAQFGIEIEMGDVSVGPTVTQFTFRPAEGVKLSKITALSNDLALALAAHPIRIEAPIPGKSLVGIEVPNQKVAVVRLREAFESDAFRKRTSNLVIALGKDVAGMVWTADIARMPHLLVAGATGSGKSVMLNAIVVSLLYQNGPDDLRLLLIDPKRVEFPIYNGIPHLLAPVITDVKKTIAALKWALAEMDRRFELLASVQKRDIAAYNTTRSDADDRLPYLVIIIDELADLMAVAAVEVEAGIIRLAQMARAVGIHLIVATQRPSVDVLTGLIKANITSRIAFAVASSIDSRTILDQVGADRLLGRGDMLFTSAEISKPRRLQGAFVTDQEIERVVQYLREHGETTEYADGITDDRPLVAFTDADGAGGDAEDDDPLLADAKEVLLQAGKGSASLLQRRLKVGYARAARLLDILEHQGFIGPADGAKPREVYGGAAGAGEDADAPSSDVAPMEEERDTMEAPQ